MEKTVKIGHTDGSILSMILQQWVAYPAMGCYKLVKSPPHPDAPGESAVTLSAVGMEEEAVIAPDVRDSLCAASRVVQAVGRGQIVLTEKLPVTGDEEVKYTITIKN